MTARGITRGVYAVFTVVATAFIVSSTYQITRAVFAAPAGESAVSAGPVGSDLPPGCAEGLRALTRAVDRGLAAAGGLASDEQALARYQAAQKPEWDEARQRDLALPCSTSARGIDAAAAVIRFDRAAVGAIRRQIDELASVRRTVDSFIR